MARPIKSVWLFLLGLLGLHGGAAFAATGVLCIGNVTGESTRDAGCIDVLAWSWGISSSGGQNPPNMQDVNFTKVIDSSSDDLYGLLVTKTPVKGVYSEYRDDCGSGCLSPDAYLTVTFSDATVSSFSTGNSSGAGAATESVTLSPDAVTYCYRPTVKGLLTPPQCYGYSKTTGPL
jgi:type VI protein secretion system component Hcp